MEQQSLSFFKVPFQASQAFFGGGSDEANASRGCRVSLQVCVLGEKDVPNEEADVFCEAWTGNVLANKVSVSAETESAAIKETRCET